MVVLVALVLVILTLAAFLPVLRAGFIDNCDDAEYITSNTHVQAGLTPKSVQWAFTARHASNWHPVTWLSHMLDIELFGMNPRGHHAVNLALHIASALLLFLILFRLTAQIWPAAAVAALFAVHPMHVESVAWVAERKDVLSTFFMMLTLGAYVLYTEKKSALRYIPLAALFALGLMAKPMLVTLPIVLLLVDFWPLGRFSREKAGVLVVEKIPLFVLSIASCVMTYTAQHAGGATSLMASIPLPYRVANALIAYLTYIGKMLWPTRLAMFYPHPEKSVSFPLAAVCALALIAITFAALKLARRHPYVAVGWLWFVGTLVPVIGVIQVGGQAMADRYSYIPFIGLFLIVAYGAWELVGTQRRTLLALGASVILIALSMATFKLAGTWTSNRTVFAHAVEVTSGNWFCYNNLGNALLDENRVDEAMTNYELALRYRPGYSLAHTNLGNTLAMKGDIKRAEEHCRIALSIDPNSADAHNNMGKALAMQERYDEAIEHFKRATELQPDLVESTYNLALAYHRQGRLGEAVDAYRRALVLDPAYGPALTNLPVVLLEMKDYRSALTAVQDAQSRGVQISQEIIDELTRAGGA